MDIKSRYRGVEGSVGINMLLDKIGLSFSERMYTDPKIGLKQCYTN